MEFDANEQLERDTDENQRLYPVWGAKNDCSAHPDGSEPGADCVSICIQCGHIAIFNADLSVREPTTKELARLQNEPTVMKYQHAVRMAHAEDN